MDAYIGEIRIFSFPYVPAGWLQCEGGEVPINQYQALAAVILESFGGDGKNTIGLPDLRGQVPLGTGTGVGFPPWTLGEKSGATTATLSGIPSHTHTWQAQNNKTPYTKAQASPNGAYLSRLVKPTGSATFSNVQMYSDVVGSPVSLQADAVSIFGGGTTGAAVAHDNMQPYLPMNFCICNMGTFPEQP